MQNREESTIVFFVQKVDEGVFETESIWCTKKGDNFIIDNIPFIAKRISLGDTIAAEFDDDDKQYYFDSFIEVSGNTTIRIFAYDEDSIVSTRKWLSEKECESEVLAERNIIAVNIPVEVIYTPIKAYLEDGEKAGKWTYEESCLAHNY